MTDQRIQYTEKMVGAGYPTLPDTLNRITLVEHNNDGTHAASVARSGSNSDITRLTGLTTPLTRGQGGTGYAQAVSPIFAFRHTPVSVTGTTNETELYNVTIPGGTLGPNGVLKITLLFSFANSTNLKTFKFKFGGVQVWSVSQTSASIFGGQMVKLVINRNSESAQIWTAQNTWVGIGGGVTAAHVAGAINTAVDQAISVTGQLASTGETITLESVMVEVLK